MTYLTRPRSASVLFREVPDVRLVDEIHVIGHAMHADPVDGNPTRVEVSQLLDLRLFVADRHVTTHAEAYSRDRRGSAFRYVAVTEGAVETQVFDVRRMGERYRLIRAIVYAERIQGQSEPCRNDERRRGEDNNESDDTADAKCAKKDEPTPRRPSWCLKIAWQQVRLPY